jgi:FkbM family methyltransferase
MSAEMRERLRAWAARQARPWFDGFTYTARSGPARGLRRRGGLGFLPGRPPTAEERWLLGRDWRGQAVFDIGAWEGVLALFFARAVGPEGAVVAFEPHPRHFRRLAENLALNGFAHARALPLALGAYDGAAPFASDAVAGRSRLVTAGAGATVPVARLDTLMAAERLPPPDFIKIDVEGAELDVLLGAGATLAARRPRLLIEVHPEAPAADLLRYLDGLGYRLWQVEAAQPLQPGASTPAGASWHLAAEPQQSD